MKIPDIFVPEKNFEESIERLLKKPQEPIVVQPKHVKFKVIPAGTYAEGIAKLKKRGRKPFTFFENIEAFIADYVANGEDARLFDTWLDSVTGIAYKARSTKFKLILRSDKLENIPQYFNQSFIPIDYDAEQGVKLDSKEDEYNIPLMREEAKNHKFWLAVMNGDKEKLERYVDIWFDKTGIEEGLGVYLIGNTGVYLRGPSQDELRALSLNGNDSYIAGYRDFDYDTCFLSGAKQK